MVELIKNTFIDELDRIPVPSVSQSIKEWLLNLVYTTKISLFFNFRAIESLCTDAEFTVDRFDYISAVTDRINIGLRIKRLNVGNLILAVVEGIDDSRDESLSSSKLINKHYTSGMAVNVEELKILLRANPWILYIYIFILFFNNSELELITSQKD